MDSNTQIFINELSLHEQFFVMQNFEEAVLEMINLIRLLREKGLNKEYNLYKNELFVNSKALKNEDFRKSFNSISNIRAKSEFRDIIFGKGDPINWQDDQKHNPKDEFTYEQERVSETSMAELAERKLQNPELSGLLLNFIESKLKGKSEIAIIKNQQQPVSVDSADNTERLEKWLEKTLRLSPEYDPDSKEPPLDLQTILRDAHAFGKTKRYEKNGRCVHKEYSSGRLMYVDSLHSGHSAHLEVFDKRGKHLGEASLNAKLKPNTADPKKKLRT